MSTQTTIRNRRIELDPALPIAGLSMAIVGAILFGLGMGLPSVPIGIVGAGMLILGMYIMVGFMLERGDQSHRKGDQA